MIVEDDYQPYLVRSDDSPAEFGELPGESHCLRIIQNVLGRKNQLLQKKLKFLLEEKPSHLAGTDHSLPSSCQVC